MRKLIYLVFFMIVFPMNIGGIGAAELKNGFFDIQWKTDLSHLPGFKKVGENLNVSYFINPRYVYSINDIEITDVVYGAFENQFFAVYINIDNIEVFAQLKRHMNRNYGLPRIKKKLPSELTIYQWKHQKTKIKLKLYENNNNMKLAFYHTPLSRKVNESQQEAFHENYKNPVFPLTESRQQKALDLMDLQGLGPPGPP